MLLAGGDEVDAMILPVYALLYFVCSSGSNDLKILAPIGLKSRSTATLNLCIAKMFQYLGSDISFMTVLSR